MLKKKKLIVALIFMTTALLASILGVSTIFASRVARAELYEVETEFGEGTNKKNFSMVGKYNNVIFSAEKVLVVSSDNEIDDDNIYEDFTTNEIGTVKEFVEDESTTTRSAVAYGHSFATGETGKNYYFKDYDSDKEVIYNGKDVLLTNEKNANGKYQLKNDENLQEAVMISIGGYVVRNSEIKYNSETETKNGNTVNVYDKIQDLKIFAYHNGSSFVDLPSKRKNYDEQDNDIEYQDFVYIIPQTEENEGHWKFEFSFFKDGKEYNQEFEFYLMFETSYTQNLTEGSVTSVTYIAKPTLMKPDSGSYSSISDGVNNYVYNLGSSDNFPLLTFDPRHYNVTYTYRGRYETKTNTFSYDNGELLLNGEKIEEIDDNEKIVTLMFTEPGEYTINYDYVYTDQNGSRVIDSFKTQTKTFQIKGFNVKYPLTDKGEEFRHLVFADASDAVELVVSPETIGSYDINTDTRLNGRRVGTSVTNGMVNENYTLNANVTNAIGSTLIENLKTKNGDGQEITNFLKSIKYSEVKTNLGAVKVDSALDYIKQDLENAEADKRTMGSFYYFSKTIIDDYEDLFESNSTSSKVFDNTVTFNQTGYYLVFIKVNANTNSTNDNFYQIFAFQYSTDSIGVVVTTEEGQEVGAYGYTNQDVRVSWKEPERFERKVQVSYEIKNGYEKGKTGKLEQNGVIKLDDEKWAEYNINLSGAGKSSTETVFTIDKTPIGEIKAYKVTGSNNSFKVEMEGSSSREVVMFSNGKTTLSWEEKDSGASTFASYTFTPFVKTSSKPELSTTITASKTTTILRNGYALSESESASYSFSKPFNLTKSFDDNSVIYEQGIYQFTIEDIAGNSCKYLFVIDNSPAFFKVDYTDDKGDKKTEYIYNVTKMYGDKITVSIGNYKGIFLGDDLTFDTSDFRNCEDFKNLFKNITLTDDESDDKFQYNGMYLLVENLDLLSNQESEGLTRKPRNDYDFTKPTEDEGVSKVGYFYVVGRNEINNVKGYESINDYKTDYLNSSVTLEINTDNSKGLIYYGNVTLDNGKLSQITDVKDEKKLARLYYVGTGEKDGNKYFGTNATKDNVVVFTWEPKIGDQNYKLSELKVEYFPLSISTDENGNKLYSYNTTGFTMSLYNGSQFDESVIYDGTTAYAVINLNNGQTQEGLYEITRTYEASGETFTYRFIVDRRNIVDVNGMGDGIYIHLNNETKFDDFTKQGLEEFEYNYDTKPQKYYVYLTTNKVPAEIEVPIGKFMTAVNEFSKYKAGALNLEILYSNGGDFRSVDVDTSNWGSDDSNKEYHTTKFKTDLWKVLSNSNWLYQDGTYIIRITDNVKTTSDDKNVVSLGFKISRSHPEIPVYTSNASNMTYEDAINRATEVDKDEEVNTIKLTTNERYLFINIPKYVSASTKAGVETTITVNGTTANGKEEQVGQYKYIGDEEYYPICIDTTLSKENKDYTTYTFEVKYRSSSNDIDKCYGKFLTTKYVITIDREAPKANINKLMKGELAKLYAENYKDSKIMEEFKHEVKSSYKGNNNVVDYYYTYEYVSKNEAQYDPKVFAFPVKAKDEFEKSSDLAYVYSKKFDKATGLTKMPVVDFATYAFDKKDNISNYESLINGRGVGYYEIIEKDIAGNMTQYVVYYGDISKPSIKVNDSEVNDSNNMFAFATEPKLEGTAGTYDFFVVEFNNKTYYSNFDVSLQNILDEIEKEFNKSLLNYGTYSLKFKSQGVEININLSFADPSTADAINIVDWCQDTEIIFPVVNQESVRYPKQISVTYNKDGVTTTDVYVLSTKDDKYHKQIIKENGDKGLEEFSTLRLTNLSGTYIISYEDVFDDKDFAIVKYGTDGKKTDYVDSYVVEKNYATTGDIYHFADSFSVYFDNVVYNGDNNVEYTIISADGTSSKGTESLSNITSESFITLDESSSTIKFNHLHDKVRDKKVEITLTLVSNVVDNKVYKFVLDTSYGNVLVSDTNGNLCDNKVHYNVNENIVDALKNGTITSGESTMGSATISWSDANTQYTYSYKLFEVNSFTENNELKYEIIKDFNIDGLDFKTLETTEGNSGIYVFVATVSLNGTTLGNKVYCFTLTYQGNKFYQVISNGKELTSLVDYYYGDKTIPLYISNSEIEIITAKNRGFEAKEHKDPAIQTESNVKIYKISNKEGVEVYIATMYIEPSKNIISKLEVNGNIAWSKDTNLTRYIHASRENSVINISATKTDTTTYNSLIFDVYFGNQVLDENFVGSYIGEEISLKGNGKYLIKVRDYAGNSQDFNGEDNNNENYFEVIKIDKIAFLVNDKAPLVDGYYSGDVKVSLANPEVYDMNSISFSVFKRGKELTVPYNAYEGITFSDYGTYRVVVNAKYTPFGAMENETVELVNALTFTIINPNEAFTSVDLDLLKNYEIQSAVSHSGRDVKDDLMNLLSKKSLVTYEDLIAQSKETGSNLGTIVGKYSITVTYKVQDSMYPNRTETFTFTLNNEVPKIKCSLKSGESSTKSFTITLNPAMIYDQVGEAVLYVNGQEFYRIEGNPDTQNVKLKFTEKKYGSGSYYITLESSSGNVLNSFKVRLKEPLNTSAIIIIVVVSTLVVGVVVTIIILRRRMRIR
ncbi:MAG: hypothetical protein E7374_01510 [Clostridiales bacterium]|nr:hypothetical protein [Clostridiales bacterium]